MAKNLLNDTSIRNTKPGDKDQRLNDGEGLYLLIKSNGAKWWRFDYSINGKRKTLSAGTYPATGLADARRKAEEARKLIANDIDPSDTRKAVKKARSEATENEKRIKAGLPVVGSFEDVARQWLDSTARQIADCTHQKRLKRFTRFTFPIIGGKAIGSVSSADIFSIIKPLISDNKLITARLVRSEISAVFCYAIAHSKADYDPAQPVLKQIPSGQVTHRAALTNPKEIARLMRDIDDYQGTFTVKTAFRLMALLFQRPGEIRQMQWADIDLESREWRYFVTKTRVNHIVPLSSQAIAILEEIRPLTGSGRYVFPNRDNENRPMSEGTLSKALAAMGYGGVMTAHGFRSVASTLLNEQCWSPDAIERQLAHMPRDSVRAAYNRAQYLDERRRMMQAWSDYLDSLRSGADVIPIGRNVVK
jgi:integrase